MSGENEQQANYWAEEYAKAKIIREQNIENLAKKNVEKKNPPYTATDLVSGTAKERKASLVADFPQLKAENYGSETEYKQALIDQYAALRQKKYEYVCRNEGIKAYNLARDITNSSMHGGNKTAMNKEIWSGCKHYLQANPQKIEEFNDSCYARVVPNVTNSLENSYSAGLNCCAITSKSLVSKISAEMGYDGQDNLIKTYNAKDKYVSCHRAGSGFKNDPACKDYVKQGSLWNLLDKGQLGAGDMIAYNTGVQSNTVTGWHAKTIIAVERDKDGKLLSYTLQANNNLDLQVVSSRANDKKVLAASTNQWMQEKLAAEKENCAALSVAEIEQKLSAEKQSVEKVIDNMQTTEAHLFGGRHNIDNVKTLEDQYAKNASTENKESAAKEHRQSESYLRQVNNAKMRYTLMDYSKVAHEVQKSGGKVFTEKDITPEMLSAEQAKINMDMKAGQYQQKMRHELKMNEMQIVDLKIKESMQPYGGIKAKEFDFSQAKITPLEIVWPGQEKEAVKSEMKENAEDAQILANKKIEQIRHPEQQRNNNIAEQTAPSQVLEQTAAVRPQSETQSISPAALIKRGGREG